MTNVFDKLSLWLNGKITGFKEPIETFEDIRSLKDIHCWVKTDDGEIHDYAEDDDLRAIKGWNGLEGDMIRVPMRGEEKKKAFKKLYKKVIKPKLKLLCEKSKEEREAILYTWINQSGYCFYRAYILSKILSKGWTTKKVIDEPELLLDSSVPCIGFELGSAGWKHTASGQVWYEFG